MLKIGEIRELIRLLDETSIAELKIEHDDMKLHLKKADTSVVFAPPVSAPVQAVAPTLPVQVQVEKPANESTAAVTPIKSAGNVEDKSVHFIKSPMVGTFYLAPSPDAPAYADVGTAVGPKTVVCIVEAMKLMNEIEAEISGEVVEVLAENGQLVEYGQPLFKIRLS